MTGTYNIFVFVLTYLLVSWFDGVTSKVSICPTYCTCTNNLLNCENGYTVNSRWFNTLPKNFSNIRFHNFVLRELTAQHFQWFEQLNTITITDSRMRSLDEYSFAKLPLLTTIDLQNNHLSEIPSHTFANQRNLTSLSLSHNIIERLPEQLFTNTTRLHTLRISHNRIRLLPSKLFDGLTNLVHLDLSHNEISYILPRTFSFISVVRYIDLSDNLLVTLHEDLFDSNNITVDTKLSVVANPLDCNCGLIWLQEAIKGKFNHLEMLNASDIVCANPRIYVGQKLSDVPLEHLNCTRPTANVRDASDNLYHGNKVGNH